MSREELKKYFDILEISLDASFLEVKNAYLRLKNLYSTDSIVISPIADEFPIEKRQEILRQIDEAYMKITELFRDNQRNLDSLKNSVSSGNGSREEKSDIHSYSGPALKEIREKLGIHLFKVAIDTKIRIEILENIESESYESLPHEAYLKAHVMNYARYLLLDPKRIAEDYMKRYSVWKEKVTGEE